MTEGADEAGKRLFPDQQWRAMWQTEALHPFAPQRGATDDPLPMLEVHYSTEGEDTRGIALIGLAIAEFNVWEKRREMMRVLGEKWAYEGWQVLALRFSTCAWLRRFSQDELQARGDRLVETYPDKQEIVMVQGSTIDGRQALATAEILRDKVGRVRAIRPWDVKHAATSEGLHLDFSTLDEAWKAYLRVVMVGIQARTTPQC